MAAAGGRVFISYSRRDYYFAESLTLQLRRQGVAAWMDVLELQPGAHWESSLFEAIDGCAAFVLVASPAALASDAVRREWQRALAAGKRVLLLGWHRRVRLPVELQGCEWVDGRGRFGAALKRLMHCLASPDAKARPAGPHPGGLPKMPPAVWTALLALILPVAGWLLLTLPDETLQDEDLIAGLGRAGTAVLFILLGAALVWWLTFSLMQRRMGMTRLLFNLVLVSVPYLLASWNVFARGAAGVAHMQGDSGLRVMEYLPWIWAMAALPLCTLAWVLLARPRGLLHWMPLGKAWDRMRRPGPGLAPSAATPAQALASVGSYRLVHDPADAPMADGLRAQLAGNGAVEVGDGAERTLLLLSNRSDRQWLALHDPLVEDPGLMLVVGSAVSLPPTLGALWRRQWIDLRRGALPPGSTAALLPLLPEAVTQHKLPVAVSRLHALLCGLGMLLCVLGYMLAPAAAKQHQSEDVSVVMLLGVLLGGLLVWQAHRLLHRVQPAPAWRRWLQRLLLAVPVFVLLAPLAPGLEAAARVLGGAGAVMAIALAYAGWRRVAQVQAWLPAPGPLPPAARRLAPPQGWRTTLVLTAWMFVWILPVQWLAPQLMG